MYSTDVKFKKLKIIFPKTFFYLKFLLELKSYCSSRIYLHLLFYEAYWTWLLFSFFSSQNHSKFMCSLYLSPSFHFSSISPRFEVLLLSYVLENISICRKNVFPIHVRSITPPDLSSWLFPWYYILSVFISNFIQNKE